MSDYILELEEACNTLKKHCETQDKCEDCIFHNNKGVLFMMCHLQDIPEVWSIDKIFNKGE